MIIVNWPILKQVTKVGLNNIYIYKFFFLGGGGGGRNVKTYIMESPEGDLLWVQRIMRYDNYITSALIWAVLKFVFVKLVSKEIVEVTTSDLMQIFYDVWIIERDTSLNSVKATTHCPLNASWRDRVAKKTCTSQRKSLWKRN